MRDIARPAPDLQVRFTKRCAECSPFNIVPWQLQPHQPDDGGSPGLDREPIMTQHRNSTVLPSEPEIGAKGLRFAGLSPAHVWLQCLRVANFLTAITMLLLG